MGATPEQLASAGVTSLGREFARTWREAGRILPPSTDLFDGDRVAQKELEKMMKWFIEGYEQEIT